MDIEKKLNIRNIASVAVEPTIDMHFETHKDQLPVTHRNHAYAVYIRKMNDIPSAHISILTKPSS